jgi:hypothetical protein
MELGVEQSSAREKGQTQKVQYSFTVRVADSGEHNVTFQHARRPAQEPRPMNSDGTFTETVQERTESEGFKLTVMNTSIAYTVHSNGTLATIQCSSLAKLDMNTCEAQTMVIRQALKTVNVQVATTAAETGLMQLVPASLKDVRGKDEFNRAYTRNHVQRELKDGQMHLKIHTKYDLIQLRGDGGRIAEETGKVDAGGMYADYASVEEIVVEQGSNRIQSVSSIDETAFGASNMGASDAGPSLMQTRLKSRLRANGDETTGREPDQVAPVGTTDVKLVFVLTYQNSEPDNYVHEDSPNARLMQISEPFNLHKQPRRGKIDIQKAIDDLSHGRDNAGHLIFLLDDRPDAIEPLNKAFMKVSRSRSDTMHAEKTTAAEEMMERYLTILAAVKQPQAETVLLKHLSDPEMQRTFPRACRSAMLSMLVILQRAEHVHDALLAVARTTKFEDVRNQALLVLGALLSYYASAPPTWAVTMYDHVVGHTENGHVALPVAISAVGNTKWQRAESTLCKYLATDEEFVLHNAVDGLARLPKLSSSTGESLASVLAQHNRWANHSSPLPNKMLKLIQLSSGDAKKNLNRNPITRQEKPKTNFDSLPKSASSVTLPIFNEFFPVSTSDIHELGVRATVELNAEWETKGSPPETERKVEAVASGAFELTLYDYEFTRENNNAVVELGFAAEYAKDPKTNKYALEYGVFIDVLGFRIWSSDKPDEKAKMDEKRARMQQAVGLATGAAQTAWNKAMGFKDPEKPLGNVCEGKFSIANAAEKGVSITNWMNDEKLPVQQRFTQWGMVFDLSHTKRIFKFEKKFCWTVACIYVRFLLDGSIGAQPVFAIGSDNQGEYCLGAGKTYLGGLRPYAKLDMTIELSADLWAIKVGVGGNINLLTLAVPMYARYTPDQNHQACGSVEFEVDAFSGRLYIFIDVFNPLWWVWDWERVVDFTIITWEGPYYNSQLYPGVQAPPNGQTKCVNRCVWSDRCRVPATFPPWPKFTWGRRLLDIVTE